MGVILDYIENDNENNFHCYKSSKIPLDDVYTGSIVNENSDDKEIPNDSSGIFAEDCLRRINEVTIPKIYLDNKSSRFTYFLDGSRHIYKVDDIAIGNRIFPIVAGQTVVGCCKRNGRDSFKKANVSFNIILSLPEQFHTKGKSEDFARSYCEKLNVALKAKNRYAKERANVKISKIVFYKIDGPNIDKFDKNKFLNSAIAKIQNDMTDREQLMVNDLCLQKNLNDDNWLIKDGSLEYNSGYSNMPKDKFANMRANYRHVVGVSKSFNPDLLKNFEKKKMAQIIANLKPFQRTKAYKYQSEHSEQIYAIWYVRLRKENNFRLNNFSDIVKCEKLMFNPKELISTDEINAISAELIREAYPVCYGADSRWGNHLYPVYLTESFCKAQYINSEIFLGLF